MTLTDFNTCKEIEVPEEMIDGITEGMVQTQERDYPYSEISLKDRCQKIRVVESRQYILRKTAEGEAK